MPGKTEIGWTDASWNPTTGCTHVSPGCEHCYAEALSTRFRSTEHPWTKPFERQNVKLHPDRLRLPLTWKEPRRIFVDSMSDLFHELVPGDYIAQVFAVMAAAKGHTFQVLTKRPERMQRLLSDPRWSEWVEDGAEALAGEFGWCHLNLPEPLRWPLTNVWLGTSVEDQRRAEERIPHLLATPAAIRFLSCEPLLGPITFSYPEQRSGRSGIVDALEGFWTQSGPIPWMNPMYRIDWIITGGESGPHYRRADPEWFRSIRDQCLAADVAYFHKQDSGPRPGQNRELDGRTWEQFPEVRR
jgi:protein gp37